MASIRSRRRTLSTAGALGAAAVLALAACGSSGTKAASSPGTAASSSPGSSFGTAQVAGLGTVVVDGRGRTVYLLATGATTNGTCDDASGCTQVWPDLPLPTGTATATAGPGVQPALLGIMKLADGETYATYKGWLMYEFSGDSGPAQRHGEGLHSFGGTWYALSPSGDPITAASTTATTAKTSYGY